MSGRMPHPSPRTASEPMAFTVDEFLLGVVAAWLWFNGVFAVGLAVSAGVTFSSSWGPWWAGPGIVLLYGVPVAIVASGVVTLLLCAAGWGLGRLLRHRGSMLLHVASFTLLGAAIGALVVGVGALLLDAPAGVTSWLGGLLIGCSAVAVPLGWGTTVRRSRRIESGRSRAPRPDPDAAFEDAF